jgi:integrase
MMPAMSVNVQQRGAERHQLRVIHKLLPKPFFFTFKSEPEAREYGDRLHALLERGIVPQELLAKPAKGDDPMVPDLIEAYRNAQPVAPSDESVLDLLELETAGLRVSGLTFAWVEAWVRGMKVKQNLAPSTIRKRVGSLARVLDWHLAHMAEKDPDNVRANPLRLLRVGYSQYSKAEGKAAEAAGGAAKEDVERDRRLSPDEETRLQLSLSGFKRPDRERPLERDPDFETLVYLILDTGMRLREAYRLRVAQFDFERGIINVEGTNKRGGARKRRVVPMKPAVRERMKKFVKGKKPEELVFSFWNGNDETLAKTTTRLSQRFKTLFEYAQVEDFTEHDLRHEATCRWFELKNAKGAWTFSDLEICKIMGWTSTKMALRYLSLRGEDLASRLL